MIKLNEGIEWFSDCICKWEESYFKDGVPFHTPQIKANIAWVRECVEAAEGAQEAQSYPALPDSADGSLFGIPVFDAPDMGPFQMEIDGMRFEREG